MVEHRIECIRSHERLVVLLDAWRRLWARTNGAHAFLRPEWYTAGFKHRVSEGQPLVCAVRRDGNLAGIVPLRVQRKPLPGGPFTVLTHALDRIADYTDNLFAGPGAADFVRVLETLEGRIGWDAVHYRDVPVTSELVRDLQTIAARWPVVVAPGNVCPYVPVLSTWDDYLKVAFRDSKRRNDFRRKLKKFSRLAGVRLESEDALAEGRIGYDDLAAVEQSGWRGQSGRGLFGTQARARFYAQVFSALRDEDMLFLKAVVRDDRLAAYALGFRTPTKHYFYNTAFVPELAPFNAGFQTYIEAVKACFAEGSREFDMLRGAVEYKNLLTHTARRNYRMMIFRHNGPAQAYATYLRARHGAKCLLHTRRPSYVWHGNIATAAWDAGRRVQHFTRGELPVGSLI